MTTHTHRSRLSLSVVVPAYNESRRIGATIAALCGYLRQSSWDWDVLVVDDGSTDDTASAAAAAAAHERRVAVRREPHRGKGAAVAVGLQHVHGAFRFMCDADLSMPIAQIERFLPPFARGDVVIGTREGERARRVGEPWRRHAVGRAFNLAVRALVLPGIHDSQCGFKMLSAAAAETICPSLTIDGWGFDVEMLALARLRGLTIVEVPIEWHYRSHSHVRVLRDARAMLTDVWAIRRQMRAGRYR
jgi:glycosyltransferase involved in cell wall biosynthesis